MLYFNNIGAVIFDFDGTLYDYRKISLKLIMKHPLDMFKMRAERDIRRNFKGIDFSNSETFYKYFCEKMKSRTGMNSKRTLDWYNKRYMPSMIEVLAQNYRHREKVLDLFKYLKNNSIKIAVLSDYPLVKERMKAIGFTDEMISLCDIISSAQDTGALKPCARPFLEIAEKLNVNPEDVLVVGDRNDTDGQGAKKAGMRFLKVKSHKSFGTDWKDIVEGL